MFHIIIQSNRSYESALIIIICYYCYYYYKKGDVYATTVSWLCAKVSFAILQSAILCKMFKNEEMDCENSSWSWFRECCCYYNVEFLFFKVTFNFSFYIFNIVISFWFWLYCCLLQREGKPYCHIPCYSALFGPKGYGHGGTESHKYDWDILIPDDNRLVRRWKILLKEVLTQRDILWSNLIVFVREVASDWHVADLKSSSDSCIGHWNVIH